MTTVDIAAQTVVPSAGTGLRVTAELQTDVVVVDKRVAADGVVVLTLRSADGQPLPAWAPGAHVDLVLGARHVRQYSLCGDPRDLSAWRIGILREELGTGTSRFIRDELQPGDAAVVHGPRNHFALEPATRYLFIAGGIGITPLLPMIRAADAAGAQWRLAYGGRQRASMAFLDELARYGTHVTITPHDESGLLPLDSLLGTPDPHTLVYCCGPEALLQAVEERFVGRPPGALHVERFAPKPVGEPARSEPFEIYLQDSGISLMVPPDRSILSVVEEAGITVLTPCEEGTCGTCETAVLDGVPDHRDSVLTAEERQANDCMMVCVSRSCTTRLVLEL